MSDEVKTLKSIVRQLLGWASCGACADCIPFRAAPCEIEWQHAKDCGHLETINKAYALLGLPPEEGHTYPDPEGEMHRLAQQRTEAFIKRNNKS